MTAIITSANCRSRTSGIFATEPSVDPDRVKKLKWGGQFYDASGGEFSACLDKVRQTGKDQKCTVTVPVPAK